MKEQALAKLQAEMEVDKSGYAQVVGAYLQQHVTRHPADAALIMAEGKTIAGSLKAMEAAAKLKKTGSCAVLTDAEGFEVVLKYYGIEAAAVSMAASAPGIGSSLDEYL